MYIPPTNRKNRELPKKRVLASPAPDFGATVDSVIKSVSELEEIKLSAIEEVDAKVEEATKAIDELKSIGKEVKEIALEAKNEAIQAVKDIKQGEDGKDGKDADEQVIIEKVLSKIKPEVVDYEKVKKMIPSEKKIAERVIKYLPENKSSLKIIQEKFETDPMSVIEKIMQLPADKFRLKAENIDGLEQTISAFRNQLGRGYLHGGGASFGNLSVTQYAVVIGGSSPNSLAQVSGLGNSGQVLKSNGVGNAPTWQDDTAGTPGGTSGQLQYNNAGSFGGVSEGSSGQVLVSAGVGLPPVFTSLSSIGVTSITGTANQVIASSPTGAVTLSLPQDIGTSSTPQFAGVKTAYLFPASDSTTAVQIRKANGTSSVFNVDTTNSRVGIGTTTPSNTLEVVGVIQSSGGATGVYARGVAGVGGGSRWASYGTSADEYVGIYNSGYALRLSFGGILLPAGTTTSAPLAFQSGTSLTSPSAGTMEFTTDDLFFTITTGTARKRLLMADPVGGLTSGRVLFATTNGRLTDSSNFTYDGSGRLNVLGSDGTAGVYVGNSGVYYITRDGGYRGYSGASLAMILSTAVSPKFHFNYSNQDIDFIWYGDNFNDLIYGDASTDRLGFGTNSPGHFFTIAPPVRTSGAISDFNLTASAHTNLTASTEVITANFNLSATIQHATGALTTQRAMVVQAPTYSFVGASTITNAATFAITGAPVAGTNATITNAYAFWVQAGVARFDGGIDTSAQNIITDTSTGTKIGTAGGSSGQKLGFFGATPIVQPLLATGAGATVDNVITALQNLGLVRQS